MATVALVLGSLLVVAFCLISFLCGYLYRGNSVEAPPLSLPRINLGKGKTKKVPKYLNEEQLAKREALEQAKRAIAMTEQEAADQQGF